MYGLWNLKDIQNLHHNRSKINWSVKTLRQECVEVARSSSSHMIDFPLNYLSQWNLEIDLRYNF